MLIVKDERKHKQDKRMNFQPVNQYFKVSLSRLVSAPVRISAKGRD